MVEDQDKRLEAVYMFKKRLENAQKRLLRDRGIHQENKQKILEFIKHLKSKGRSDPTQIKYLIRLTRLASMLGKEFSKCNKRDIQELVEHIRTKQDWSDNTKEAYKIALKVFFPWLRG